MVRQVSPADAFHAHFVDGLRSFAGVSASLFVGGDAFAALGDLEIEARAGERLQRDSVPSPFPYAEHMRVVALEGGSDLVGETTVVLESLARQLGGRTLGLFTSLRRMYDVSDELAPRLREEGIDVLAPRRASDDPSALVSRFVAGAAVLLGARKFWQGIDIPGDRLQAVVIEKLPFEVPTELRRRREERIESQGIPAFQRCTLGRMLLNLKQMVGRLIRTEEDRGIVVIVEGRTDKGYFRRLEQALPPGSHVSVATAADLSRILAEVGIEGD
jgi:ATP-dependent DNA helicase DinG